MQYRSMRHTPAVAALALAAASPGCEHVVCPAIGFASTVELTLRDDAWQDGVYAVELELTLADDARRCEAEIERRAGAWQLGTLTTACDGEPPQPEVELTATESELRVLVEDSWFHADALVVHVSRDGNELLARATELSYRVTEHPFGEECGGPQRAVVVIEAP